MRNNVAKFKPDDPLLAWWRRYRPYWHIMSGILCMVFLSGIAWAQYKEVGPKIENHEARISSNEKDISSMKQNLQDLHDWYAFDHGKAAK